ncbi:MAG TPA: LysM peptidoglycan-binding domain-containing protein, partial [Halanaerobiales bacterium]|nr:LysM peptidoglycan-binding domain-containing protein [Halanaerobiales bacterium]
MKRLSKFSSYIIFLFVFILLYNTSSFAIVHPGEYNEQFKFSEFQLQSQTYYVQSGDSLYSIAQQFGVSIADIKRINNISNVIYPGQQLIIPGAQNQLIYRVQTGDSLYKIASRFNVTVASIRNANKLSSDWLVPGQELMIPGTGADAIINNNITIVVDAGHGGYDPGAVTYYNSRLVKESEL